MSVSYRCILMSLMVCSGLGCTSAENDNRLLEEDPVYLLQSRYTLNTELVFTNCDLSLAQLSSTTSSVEVRQTGNYIKWTQYPSNTEGQSSEPMSMAGAVCAGSDGSIELRLRGRSVSRRSAGSGYCRTEFSIPASASSCLGRVDEICNDPEALILTLDPCRNGFFGRTNSCLRYEESCSGTADCQLTFHFSAYPSGSALDDGDCPAEADLFIDRCETDCNACGCTGSG